MLTAKIINKFSKIINKFSKNINKFSKIINKFSSVIFQLSRELSKEEGDGSKNVTLTVDFAFFKFFRNSFQPAAFKLQMEINLSELNSWGQRSICRLSALSVLKVINNSIYTFTVLCFSVHVLSNETLTFQTEKCF